MNSGAEAAVFGVGDLEGRHQVRVVIDGVEGSPLLLGTLQLDRTPPVISSPALTPRGRVVEADWIQSDALSGSDPATAPVAEVNAAPDGGAGGEWVAFAEGAVAGDGRKVARTSLAGLPDGRHLVRVRARDRAGNAATVTLGMAVSDATAPVVADLRVTRPPRSGVAVAEIAFRAGDGAGVGLAPGGARVGPVGSAEDWTLPGASDASRVLVRLPGPGLHLVTVRVSDRMGNAAESAPLGIRVPTAAEAADAAVAPLPRVGAGRAVRLGPHLAWAQRQVRRFHARRGVAMTARLRVARTPGQWRGMLGGPGAAGLRGFATMRGQVLIGPSATRGLESLRGAAGGRRGRPPHLSRADLDRAVLGLAVLLHETIHASGPAALADVEGSRSGRAFEEGMTEAATVDLLPAFVARLGLPRATRARLAAAVRRYRPAYPARVAWARRASARATGAAAASARARAWRVAVADTWGADRWARLAAATGVPEEALRAEAARAGSGGR